MKIIIYFLLGIYSLMLISCQEKPMITIKDEAGNIIEKYEINADSLKDGIHLSFYPNGDTFSVANYEADVLNGVRKIFFENNQVEIVENYVQDTLQGPYLVYYPSGQLKVIKTYINNSIQGEAIRYYENGNIKDKAIMVDNIENGPFEEYYESGSISWKGNYRNGDNEYGELIQFAENGDTIKVMMCDERYICRTSYFNPEYAPKDEENES